MRLSVPHALRDIAAVALLACTLAGPARADALSPEDQLAAIRKGLVQAALEGPTQISATQWIDGNGALQEISAFRTGMKVRGVRVLAYGADAQGDPLAKLQWQSADPSESANKASGPKAAQCKTPVNGRLQHVLGWSWTNNAAWGADNAPLIDALKANLLAQLEQAGSTASEWRLVERVRSEGRSSYEQALLGSSADALPWQLRFELTVTAPKLAATPVAQVVTNGRTEATAMQSIPSDPPGLAVQVRMTLTARNQAKPALQSVANLNVESAQDNWSPSGLSASAREQIAKQVQAWSLALQSQLGCQSVMADVIQASGSQVRINAGAAAGVRVGDDWVLANSQSAMQRTLEPGAIAQTVLAKVQSVGEHYALVRPIAGDLQNIKNTWTAWPAEVPH
jgi:hypothetical protein